MSRTGARRSARSANLYEPVRSCTHDPPVVASDCRVYACTPEGDRIRLKPLRCPCFVNGRSVAKQMAMPLATSGSGCLAVPSMVTATASIRRQREVSSVTVSCACSGGPPTRDDGEIHRRWAGCRNGGFPSGYRWASEGAVRTRKPGAHSGIELGCGHRNRCRRGGWDPRARASMPRRRCGHSSARIRFNSHRRSQGRTDSRERILTDIRDEHAPDDVSRPECAVARKSRHPQGSCDSDHCEVDRKDNGSFSRLRLTCERQVQHAVVRVALLPALP